MNEPIFLKPCFQDRIWGGTALQDRFQYEIPTDTTGECWAISAHPNGQSVVLNGEHEGKTLAELWSHSRELFGGAEGEVFPLLTKILDANQDLSVQVHPEDDYARVNENGELGKTECWYIIDCEEDAEMIFGHTAQTKEQLDTMIENNQWSDLLQRVKIKPGDFFYVPSGTIHALCKGTLVLETQQSSDTTYRVYDYNREDQNGKKRELHIDKALDVTTVPHVGGVSVPEKETAGDLTITTYVKEHYFTVYKWSLSGRTALTQPHPFLLGSVIEGHGQLRLGDASYLLNAGDHFILPSGLGEFEMDGELEIIVSHI